MRESQRKLIEKRIAIGKFKRTHSDIPVDEISLEYKDGRFVFIYDDEVIDKIKIGENNGQDNSMEM